MAVLNHLWQAELGVLFGGGRGVRCGRSEELGGDTVESLCAAEIRIL